MHPKTKEGHKYVDLFHLTKLITSLTHAEHAITVRLVCKYIEDIVTNPEHLFAILYHLRENLPTYIESRNVSIVVQGESGNDGDNPRNDYGIYQINPVMYYPNVFVWMQYIYTQYGGMTGFPCEENK